MKRNLLSLLIVVVAVGSLLAQAQDPGGQPPPPAGQPGGDAQGQPGPGAGQYEPGRAVARISVLNGDVSVRRGDSGDVVAAVVNAPIVADDRVLTGAAARAEVQLDFGNVVRIAPNSEVRFVGMDMKSFQLQVAAGSVTFRVLRQSPAQAEVDTPSVAMHPLRQGAYRVTVNEDGTSQITVRSGEAEIFSQNGSEHLQPGQTMNARGPANDPEYQVVQAIAPDAWDRWNDDRDRLLLRSQSYKYVSPEMSGAEDLDQNGQWTNDPAYGNVWQPTNVPPGWAPYSNGRWVWEDWYGWTWVSYDPWGWAPYHYGRWFMGPAGWAWYPGPIYGNYFWSPALVGFFGFGGGFGIGFGFGGIGWVALAPFEAFHPWWGRGFYGGFRTGAFGTSIVSNVNVANTFRNARVAGGAIGTNTADFGRRGGYSALNSSQLRSAGLVHGALPVSPDRSSLRATDRAASANVAQSRSQSFASHAQAARVDRVSFDQQQRGIQQMARSNLSSAGRTGAGNSGLGGSSAASHGWSRFGEPIHNSGSAASGSAERGSYGGYNGSTYARPGGSPYASGARGSYGGSGQAVRISPPIVQQRGASGGYSSAPRSAPSYSGGGRSSSAPARSSGGGGGARPSGGGGGGHAGGGHGGGGHR